MDKELINALREVIIEELKPIREDISQMQSEISHIKTQLTEHTQILRALEHKSEVNKTEHENFAIQLARIEGSINSLKEEISKSEEAVNFVQGIKNIIAK